MPPVIPAFSWNGTNSTVAKDKTNGPKKQMPLLEPTFALAAQKQEGGLRSKEGKQTRFTLLTVFSVAPTLTTGDPEQTKRSISSHRSTQRKVQNLML